MSCCCDVCPNTWTCDSTLRSSDATRVTDEPAWPGRALLDRHPEIQRLSGTPIDPSRSRPTLPTEASTPIAGIRRRDGVIGPLARWKVSSTGGGAGLASATTVEPMSSVPAGAATAAIDCEVDLAAGSESQTNELWVDQAGRGRS